VAPTYHAFTCGLKKKKEKKEKTCRVNRELLQSRESNKRHISL